MHKRKRNFNLSIKTPNNQDKNRSVTQICQNNQALKEQTNLINNANTKNNALSVPLVHKTDVEHVAPDSPYTRHVRRLEEADRKRETYTVPDKSKGDNIDKTKSGLFVDHNRSITEPVVCKDNDQKGMQKTSGSYCENSNTYATTCYNDSEVTTTNADQCSQDYTISDSRNKVVSDINSMNSFAHDIDTPYTSISTNLSSDRELYLNKPTKQMINRLDDALERCNIIPLTDTDKSYTTNTTYDYHTDSYLYTASENTNQDTTRFTITNTDNTDSEFVKQVTTYTCDSLSTDKHLSESQSRTDCKSDNNQSSLVKYMLTYINEKVNMIQDNKKTADCEYYKIQDIKRFGRTGGSSMRNRWLTRDLTTQVSDTVRNVKLNNDNSFTLQAGLYRVTVKSSFYNTGGTKIRLYETSKQTTLAQSINKYVSIDDNKNDTLDIDDYINVPYNTVYTVVLQYFCEFDIPDNGLGVPAGIKDSTEFYTQILLTRV